MEQREISYYKKRITAFSIGKWVCNISPILICLIVYVVMTLLGQQESANEITREAARATTATTNTIDPVKFPLGVSIAAVFAGGSMIRESKKNRAVDTSQSEVQIDGAINWGVLALVLYLCYISLNYIIAMCASESVGQIGGLVFNYHLQKNKKMYDKLETANFNASAIVREQEKERKKVKVEPTE